MILTYLAEFVRKKDSLSAGEPLAVIGEILLIKKQ